MHPWRATAFESHYLNNEFCFTMDYMSLKSAKHEKLYAEYIPFIVLTNRELNLNR
jgi:hypothetical protein